MSASQPGRSGSVGWALYHAWKGSFPVRVEGNHVTDVTTESCARLRHKASLCTGQDLNQVNLTAKHLFLRAVLWCAHIDVAWTRLDCAEPWK